MAGYRSVDIEVGILLYGHVREFLDREIYKGKKISYREGKGWLSRTFTIRGYMEENDALDVASDLQKAFFGDQHGSA